MRWAVYPTVVVVAIAVAACGADSEPERADLEAAQQEAERQRRAQERAEARLDAVQAGTRSSHSVASVENFEQFTAGSAGWSAEVPTGPAWSGPTETEITPERLYRTEFMGPSGTVLIVDATPFDAPSFSGAPIESRERVEHPALGSIEKIIFQGNSDITFCQSGLCVDYLIPYQDGGYAVLAGGAPIAEIEAIAERVVDTLRYYDY